MGFPCLSSQIKVLRLHLISRNHFGKDMLRACVIDFKGSWDDHLPLIEFAYNNSFHSGIHMAPYEALYERRCKSLVGWFEVGSTSLNLRDHEGPICDHEGPICNREGPVRDCELRRSEGSFAFAMPKILAGLACKFLG
ncbi:hypothetical protein MTR67_038600 [Solanum verrucosum]|uniref:Uncharacterized protein n=1 Tax=Solanum verrucosum TaxID=315347 RepID=A0AAF0ZPU6_SOLVR|nr:hypothetical protein MTR67_038600 [Solanum verrucosum]